MREIKWVRVTPGVTLLKVTPPNIFNQMLILINLPLDYIIFVYYPYLQNLKMIKDQQPCYQLVV